MNLVLRQPTERMGVRDAVCLLLDIDAEALGKLAQIEVAFIAANGEEDAQRREQQNPRQKNQCAQPFNG